MAMRNLRVGLLAAFASLALAGCLPEVQDSPSPAPAEEPANSAPAIGGTPPPSATVGSPWQFVPSASDPDGDPLTFAVVGVPGWLTFNTQTGALSGTPTQDDAGTSAAIVITVSDGESTASLPAFSIAVSSATPVPSPPPPSTNSRPSISGTPALTVQATSTYTFVPTAQDMETPQESLVFSILNKPSWASFSTTTGALTGTPAANQVGTYAGVVISVSDGSLTAVLPAFTITVTSGPNRPPVISGSPATTVRTSTAYSFRPTATDPDGQTLSYSITNKPSWASFSTTTGRLSGTPAATDVGVTTGIVITATDSAGASASLPGFSISVTPAPSGAAALSWTAPTQNTDGSALAPGELAAYRIYHGTSAASLDRVAEVDGGSTDFTFRDLGAGTHYFAVTAVSSAGAESSFSTIQGKTIP